MTMMRIDDLLITVAYFSIPTQIIVALYQYPRLTQMPWHILTLAILFALFIFLCGTGHLMRCLGMTGPAFGVLNACTALISLITAVYLLPLIPNLFESIDKALQDLLALEAETDAKRKLMTFMSFLCHEIRNPLFAITSTVSFLEDDNLTMTMDQRNAIDCINHSANLMLRLCNDVLDISKLESGKLQLEHHAFDLRQLMRGTKACIETQIEQKRNGDVRFEYAVANRVPQVAYGDSARLLQIAYNLLSNAAKFTEMGFVRFTIDTMPMSEAQQLGWISSSNTMGSTFSSSPAFSGDSSQSDFMLKSLMEEADEGRLGEEENVHVSSCPTIQMILKIEVQDSGPGIPPEKLNTIFEPYAQSKLSDYRKHGGTGLGLSILHRITQIMGGKIHVQSKLGEGSTFTVYVPVEVPEHDADCSTLQLHQVHPERQMDLEPIVQPESLTKALNMVHTESENLLDLVASNYPSPTNSHASTLSLPALDESASALDISTRSNASATSCTVGNGGGDHVLISTSDEAAGVPKRKVLVVDDNAINRKMLGRMLSHYNIPYDSAVNGLEAVDYMKCSKNYTRKPEAPDIGLVLMDWSMPVMDGCQAITEIRKLGIDVPIVALTACPLDARKQDLLQSGATEFATKPLLRVDLYEKCKHYLRI